MIADVHPVFQRQGSPHPLPHREWVSRCFCCVHGHEIDRERSFRTACSSQCLFLHSLLRRSCHSRHHSNHPRTGDECADFAEGAHPAWPCLEDNRSPVSEFLPRAPRKPGLRLYWDSLSFPLPRRVFLHYSSELVRPQCFVSVFRYSALWKLPFQLCTACDEEDQQ